MRKIFITLCILLLSGCSNSQSGKALLILSYDNYLYMDKEATMLSVDEAYNILINKIGEGNIGENTRIEIDGVEIRKTRIFYFFRLFEDYPGRRTYTGNYLIDVYTGKVYDDTLGIWVE